MPSLISKLGFPGNRPGAVAETAGGPFMTLADDTLIPTPQGWRALGDITIGQQAFDDRTQPPADEPEVARGTPGGQAALCVALFSLLFAVVWVFVGVVRGLREHRGLPSITTTLHQIGCLVSRNCTWERSGGKLSCKLAYIREGTPKSPITPTVVVILAACPRINFCSVYRHNIPEYVLNTK